MFESYNRINVKSNIDKEIDFFIESDRIFEMPNLMNLNINDCINNTKINDFQNKEHNNTLKISKSAIKEKIIKNKNDSMIEFEKLNLNANVLQDITNLDKIKSALGKEKPKAVKNKPSNKRISTTKSNFENKLNYKRIKKRKPIEFISSLIDNNLN
jgi:hypothetical protein